jgi:predicted RND superfamily exporter protein
MNQSDRRIHDASRRGDKLRHRWNKADVTAVVVLLVPVLILPIAVRSAIHSFRNNNNDIVSWADEDLPIRQEFQTLIDHFGRPEVVVVSWPGCVYSDPQLESLRKGLSSELNQNWFANVTTARSILSEFAGIRGVSKFEIIQQMKGVLLGVDGRTACLILELAEAGREQRPVAIERIRQVAADIGIRKGDLKIGGVGAELAWVDTESVQAPMRLLPAT